jgi:catechol-2,3-dioxygenase
MATLGFSHYNLRAPRSLLEQLRSFYCDVIGLRTGERPPFAAFGYWLYAGENAVLHLSETAPGEVRSTEAATTFDHAAFNCSGRREFENKLTRLGVPYDVARVPLTGQVQLFCSDPAGNGVELNFAGEEA